MLKVRGVAIWTFGDVEARLVDAAALWRRTPGSGFSPEGRGQFASDGPWSLLTELVRAGSAMDHWRHFLDGPGREPRPPMGLSRGEMKRRDEASAWLGLIEREGDRRLVAIVTWWKGSGRRPHWPTVLELAGEAGVTTTEALRKRYNRAVSGLTMDLNGSRRAV